MNNLFSPLEGNNDVLLFNQDTFTVLRFKELLEKEVNTKLESAQNVSRSTLFTTAFCTYSIGGQVNLLLNNIQWCNSPIDCQLLKVGSQGWQKGKLRIQIDTTILFNHNSASNIVDICIEFCPDEPSEPESPLDDLRQLP